ncbi:SDR family NAD(P)-dependent oxidoreductase [Paraburkholderia phenoliruptrix]|uniref:2-(R)-hydroxypropyl-CoM dehydrogenase n=2 Tax=Paraburkholderia phenoliruptrix TaxID=252970 RepID=A0A6J5KDV3_9BURK|nr:glucose 1-dehydrogenase [Paraburkholderia phenoliruptrix]AFT90328.1 putative oxidoreductase [Paraburkholderia phenoliruptrix BR3459a]CAB4051747.1 2-(R)-hydroxypropyl-CoM dehydrogenase [Paraburkholderia phenoliruptrix]
MAGRLEGRVAVVTGSSSGNGRAIAVALAREGAHLICSDLKKGALAGGYETDLEVDTDTAITQAGGKAIFIAADASKAADVQQVIDRAVKTYGRLDIMVNNAGVFTGLHNIIEETEEQYDFTMNVNAKGVWLGCKYAITQFMKQEVIKSTTGAELRGRIVNIASIGGLVGLALEPAYCASKGAVVNLTRELAIDFAPERINVNAICPGFLATAMVRSFLEKEDTNKLLHDLTPWPRVGTAEDVARAAVFLASDDAEWMTGSMLTVDGAFTAR